MGPENLGSLLQNFVVLLTQDKICGEGITFYGQRKEKIKTIFPLRFQVLLSVFDTKLAVSLSLNNQTCHMCGFEHANLSQKG